MDKRSFRVMVFREKFLVPKGLLSVMRTSTRRLRVVVFGEDSIVHGRCAYVVVFRKIRVMAQRSRRIMTARGSFEIVLSGEGSIVNIGS